MRLAALAAGLLAALLALTAAAPARPADEPRVADSLRPFVESHTLAGAVTLVASRDKFLRLEAVGYADVAAGTPMRTDALFWIASMSKPVAATALMMLVDDGKVGLDDPVEKYLPEFKDLWLAAEQEKEHMLLKRPKHSITVRNLLSHTSGMPFKSRMEEPTLDLLPLRDAVRSYAMTPLQSEPDSKYQYSNAGINTAGRIVEVVSGVPFEDFLQKRLFDPLGMKDTTSWPTEGQLKRLAKSYKPDKEGTGLEETPVTQLSYPLSDRKRQPVPAGGLFATAADVGAFGQMVLNGGTYGGKRYVSEAAVRQMTSTQTGDLLNQGKGEGGYGLGWMTTRKAGDGAAVIPGPCGHGGAYSTNLWIDPEKGLVTVFMVQHAGFPGTDAGKVRAAFEKAAADAFAR
jgi:CubicO group peptidase (beta-lactamase class C family)